MSTRFILRFDDITPGMAWSKFLPVKEKLESIGVKSLLGVVPDCRDSSLTVEQERTDFFDYVRHWVVYGDTIAQHGTFHTYTNENSGILKINNRSEFAGITKSEQLKLLNKGKQILEIEGVWQPYFMAPAHSFDLETVKALSELNFIAITDGYGFFPYKLGNIVMVPQLTSFPFDTGFGYVTICLHINNMLQDEIDKLYAFTEKNQERFVDFSNVASIDPNADNFAHTMLRGLTYAVLACKRGIRQMRVIRK